MNNTYDIVLVEKEGDAGLTSTDILAMLQQMAQDNMLPVEVFASNTESVAMGFITVQAADALAYDYTKLHADIKAVLDDMELETPDHVYVFQGQRTLLQRI